MIAGHAALFFDSGEIEAFVPIRCDLIGGVIVPGDGVEARSLGTSACDDGIGHADDGGRIHAAAELGEDGSIGTEPALDGFRKDGAEVLFVFSVSVVTDFLSRVKIPILADGVLSGSKEHGRGWRDRMDSNVGCQMRGGEAIRKPASDILLTDREGFPRE